MLESRWNQHHESMRLLFTDLSHSLEIKFRIKISSREAAEEEAFGHAALKTIPVLLLGTFVIRKTNTKHLQ